MPACDFVIYKKSIVLRFNTERGLEERRVEAPCPTMIATFQVALLLRGQMHTMFPDYVKLKPVSMMLYSILNKHTAHPMTLIFTIPLLLGLQQTFDKKLLEACSMCQPLEALEAKLSMKYAVNL